MERYERFLILGDCYYYGRGVEEDCVVVKEKIPDAQNAMGLLLEKGAALGNQTCMKKLEEL